MSDLKLSQEHSPIIEKMSPVKQFFEKKAADRRKKKADAAHKLTEGLLRPRSRLIPAMTEPVKFEASGPSDAQIAAGSAVLASLEKLDKREYNTSLNAIRARARKEMKQLSEPSSEGAVGNLQTAEAALPSSLATSGVFYTCPMIGAQVLPRKEIKRLIGDYLRDQMERENADLAACLAIHTLNRKKEVQKCVDGLNHILENVIHHPTEKKYQRIRIMDEEFQKNVYRMEGSKEFLREAGFFLRRHHGPNGKEEDYYVQLYYHERLIQNPFMMLRRALNDAEAIRPELERSLRVLFPADANLKNELPDDFFNFTKPKYRYTLIRVRFPDEIILQGTFNVNEKLRDVTLFIQEALEEPLRPFVLSVSGKNLVDQNVSLLDLELIPGVTLQCDFDWDQSCAEYEKSFLKESILAYLKNI